MQDGDLYRQATAAPTRKLLATAIGGMLTALFLALAGALAAKGGVLGTFFGDPATVEGLKVLAAAIGAAVVTLGAGLASGYMTLERASGAVRPIDAARPDDDPPPGASLRCWAALALLGAFLLLPGCSIAEKVIPGASVWTAGVVQAGQDAADEALTGYEFGICNAATVGSVRRKYGRSAEDAERYRSFCEGEMADIIGPGEPE